MPFLERHNEPVENDTRASKGNGTESAARWTRDMYLPESTSRDIVRHSPERNAVKQSCGNPEYTKSWTMPWKNRRRPIFEGHWGCGTRCLEAVIHRALRRERGGLRHGSDEDQDALHQHRVPLGLVMLGQGWVTQPQLRTALEAQRLAGTGRIGEWLVQKSGVSSAQITRGLATQWSCPVLSIDGFAPSIMALTMPRPFVEELGVLPLRIASSRILYLAFSDRLNASVALAIEQMAGLRVESGLLDDAHFKQARERLLASEFVQTTEESFQDAESLSSRIAAILEESQPIGSRLVRLHKRYWLRTWLETGAYSGAGTLPSTGEDVTDTLFTLTSRD